MGSIEQFMRGDDATISELFPVENLQSLMDIEQKINADVNFELKIVCIFKMICKVVI